MKICCSQEHYDKVVQYRLEYSATSAGCSQEHYDKVVQYAKSINDKTLENFLERLKQWEKNENRPCEIELYYDPPYSFGFCERYPDGNTGIVGGLLYHGNPDESFAVTMERFHGWSIHT